MSGPVTLETERLILRPHQLSDFENLAAMWANPDVATFIGGTPSTREESWSRLMRYFGHWPALGFGFFVVFEKATMNFLGEVGLADFHREIEPSLDGTAEAGWVFVPKAWGKGYATEAVAAVLEWYQKTPTPRPLTCITDIRNLASQKVAYKCGFQEAARAKYKGGDIVVFRRG